MVAVTLPDGSKREFPGAVTVAQVAADIGAGLAKAALAGRVDGKLVDLSHVIDKDASVAIVTGRDADGLEIIRHSTAHLMAQAVKELYPEAQVTIGPAIENGFYYDFSYSRAFTPEDLKAIEARMDEIVKRDLPIVREEMSRDDAVAFFTNLGEKYKAELIAAIPEGETISLYRQGDFTDLCRGPHVPSTGRLKVHRLMKVAGAYWRGDSKNEMLQRIYGTAWATKDEQHAYLTMLEEAEKRDHRRLGRELDLFHLQDEAPGMIFWHAKGWALWQVIEQYMRRVYQDHGYQEVKAPQLLERHPPEQPQPQPRQHLLAQVAEHPVRRSGRRRRHARRRLQALQPRLVGRGVRERHQRPLRPRPRQRLHRRGAQPVRQPRVRQQREGRERAALLPHRPVRQTAEQHRLAILVLDGDHAVLDAAHQLLKIHAVHVAPSACPRTAFGERRPAG